MDLETAQASAQKNYEFLARDIPNKLALKEEAIFKRLSTARTSPERKLLSLYEFMAELYSYVARFIPCKKGCTSCCHYQVTISEIEIALIERKTRRMRNSVYLPQQNFHGIACPFLHKGACSIYEARPFVCRRHVTLSADDYWCNPSRSNEATFPLLAFSEIDKVFNLIRKESKSNESYDIRQVFGKDCYQNI